jgi:hypothetical protein
MGKYNGWTNRETWLVDVWFGDSFLHLHEDGHKITKDFIRQEVELYLDEKGAMSGFIYDMMDMAAINWEELANHYVELS